MTERNIQIYNKTLTSANTEYSQAFPSWMKSFTFKCRDTSAVVRFAFVSGKVATPTAPYMTLAANTAFDVSDMNTPSGVPLTVYFASATAGVVMEIIATT